MDVNMLFANQPLDVANAPATSTNSDASAGTSGNASVAVPFSQALKVLTKGDKTTANATGETKQPESKGHESSEQLITLAQTALPFVVVEDQPVADGQMIKNIDSKMLEEASERLKMLLDKANQLQQEIAVPNQIKKEMPEENLKPETIPYKNENVSQNLAKDVFGDKLKIVQTVVPEFVANNDLQQKVLAAQSQLVSDTDLETELPLVSAKDNTVEKIPEKPALVLDKQAAVQEKQMQAELKETQVLPKQNSDFSKSQNPFMQERSKTAMTDISLESKKADTGFEKEISTANIGLTTNQVKDVSPQKIVLNDQPVKFDDVKELVDKMVDQARLMQKPGISEMVIKLRPQHLGEMTIRIIAEGNTITAAFHSNNTEVRGLLQESLPAIRQELSNSGLKVHDVGVYAGLSDFQSFAGHDQRSTYDQQVTGGSVNKLTKEDQELMEELQLAKNGENQSNDGGVDYRV